MVRHLQPMTRLHRHFLIHLYLSSLVKHQILIQERQMPLRNNQRLTILLQKNPLEAKKRRSTLRLNDQVSYRLNNKLFQQMNQSSLNKQEILSKE